MRIKAPFLLVVFSLLLSFFVVSNSVSADEVQVEPKFSKNSTTILFDNKKEFNNKELIVKFKSNVTSAEKQKVLNSEGLTEVSSIFKGEFTLVSVPKGTELVTVAKKLLKHTVIEFVEPNYEAEKTFVPSDPGYKNQWYLQKIQMPKAWDVTKGSADITVAVIDGGVQTSHPDLKGKIVSPFNAVTGGNTFPGDVHGTHVAGIIAASTNKVGVTGIVPNVKIMPINAFQGSSANMFDIANAIIYAADKGANVINMSLGSYSYSYLVDYATSYAKSKGAILIAAAGNSDTYLETYPAALSSVIAVSATNKIDRITGFSNYGNYIDLAAPGEDIYSTVSGSSYNFLSGTSMAAPTVSGVAALILSKNPLLTPDQVGNILKKSSADLGGKGWDHFYGYGRVDALKALQQTSAPISTITLSANFTANGQNKNNISFTAQKETTVSAYVQNSKGTTIKKLVAPKKWNGGKVTTTWDGKQDNGLYVPSGSYVVLAKLTNGKETVYKKSTVKVTNKVKLTIKIVSSVLFSPKVKSKLTIPYEINQKATITAKIYDSKNTLVKTVLSNKSINTGKNTMQWDGNDRNGKKMKDGTYKLLVSGIDMNKVKTPNVNMSIKIDTVKPTVKIDVLSSPYKLDGTSKPGVKVTFKEKVSVTTYVTTEKGVKVKRLTNNQSFNLGAATIKWDGKDDKGKFVVEGKYIYLTEVKDAAGNVLVTKSNVFSLQDWQKITVKSTADFFYRTKANASFNYTISKPGMVTIQLLNNGKVVRTVEASKSKNAGTNKFVWDGKDQAGNILADGKYQYKIIVVDKYKNSSSYTGNMTVALTVVTIMYPSVVEFHDSNYDEYVSEVYYKLSHASTVTVEIYNSANKKVRTVEKSSRKAGINYFKWDGLEDDGEEAYWYDELFYYVIKAKNPVGNETMSKGKITNDENPDWIISHTYAFTPSDDYPWENKELNLTLNVKEPVKMNLYIYDNNYSDTEQDTVEYNLVNGKNEIRYTKKVTSDLYYIIQYKDQLGNKYHYGIDESYYQPYSMQQMTLSPEKITPK
jgi:subtilisin family serine protease